MHSTVLQTMPHHVHADAKARKMTPDRQTGQINQSSIIIDALKEEIGRSQEILLTRITPIEEECDIVHEQQAALRWTIETQIVSLHVDNVRVARWRMPAIGYGESHHVDRSAANKIRRLRHPPTTAQVPFCPSPFSRSFSTAHTGLVRQQTSPSEVNCILSSPFASSSSSRWIWMQTNSSLRLKLEHDH